MTLVFYTYDMNAKYPPLTQTHPVLCEQWDHEKNNDLKPHQITSGSKKKVWWRCPSDHSWEAAIKNRSIGNTGCPFCSGLYTTSDKSIVATHPVLVEEWDYEANGDLLPETLSANSKKKVWWRCKTGITDHKWDAIVQNRTRAGSGCPCCSNRKVVPSNCLTTTHPHLAEQWHQENKTSPNSYTAGSTAKIWWQCPIAKDHVWKSQINTRVLQGTGCPFCVGKKGSSTNNLKAMFPEIAKEWDYDKNIVVHTIYGPEEVPYGSALSVYWRCRKNPHHTWKATVNNRTSKGHSCPYCSGNLADTHTSLEALHPKICEEWDHEANNPLLPSMLLPNSHKKVWWKCRKDPTHKWKATPNNRIANCSICPYCSGSAGEFKIVEALNNLEVTFSREVRFPDCKSIKPLPFDFAIFNSSGNIIGLIEFQGGQHFHVTPIFGGYKELQKQKIRDQIKRDYCKKQGIPLLEIHYNSVGKIPQILDEFLKEIM